MRRLAVFFLVIVSIPGALRPCMAAAPPPTPAPAPAAVVAMAEGPVRLIRGAALYGAAAGTPVQQDDILETAATGAQVEAGPAIVALGPATRVLLAKFPGAGGGTIDVALLQGWVKVAAKGSARVTSPTLQVTLPAGVTIVRSEGASVAVFAEEGAQQAAPLGKDGKPGTPVKLATEQYGAFGGEKPVVGRPARDFVAALPPAFGDALVPAPAVPKGTKVVPVKQRDVTFADVADWLRAPAPLRKGFVPRFRPRLDDPAFRRELDAELGNSAGWRPILHPPPRPRRPTGELY